MELSGVEQANAYVSDMQNSVDNGTPHSKDVISKYAVNLKNSCGEVTHYFDVAISEDTQKLIKADANLFGDNVPSVSSNRDRTTETSSNDSVFNRGNGATGLGFTRTNITKRTYSTHAHVESRLLVIDPSVAQFIKKIDRAIRKPLTHLQARNTLNRVEFKSIIGAGSCARVVTYGHTSITQEASGKFKIIPIEVHKKTSKSFGQTVFVT